MDAINDAIDIRRKISFRYTNYDINKKRRVANGGIPYTVSPYTMMWDGDYYYLLGYCDERQAMRTFRLDRIERQPVILNEPSAAPPEGFNIKKYAKAVFQMFETDEPVDVELLCHADTMKTIIDVFGLDVETSPIDEENFAAKVQVCSGPTFFAWLLGFSGRISIKAPPSVKNQYVEHLKNVLQMELNRG